MKKTIIISSICLFLGFNNIFAQLPNGEKSLFYTQTGRTYEQGQLGIYSNLNFYSKIGDLLGNVTVANFESVNYWLVQSNFVFTYGIIDHLDASLGLRLYQDTHYDNEFNLPDDIFLTVKAGSFMFGRNHFSQAVLTSFRIPTGEVHNYPFTEYAPESFQYSFMYAISYYADAYLPYRSFNAHFNMGWWSYNEHGTVLYELPNGNKLKATKSSSDFRMALAFVFPTGVFDFRVEMSGMLFTAKPNTYVYSAEEWAFLSPSIRYKPLKWMAFDLGFDFRVSSGERNNTSGIPDISSNLDLPQNFPAWKMNLGLNIDLNLASDNMTNDLSYQEREARKKVELFETVVEEREKSESIQQEIDNLKKVRQEAEQEIEELKKILDDDEI